jgi:hypothetical protein
VYNRRKQGPGCRLASEIPVDELRAVLDRCAWDVVAAARLLAVSPVELKAMLGPLRGVLDATVEPPADDED